MNKEFVPYNESLELKALGFDEPCFGYYDNEGLQCGVFFWWNRENKNSLFVKPEKTNNPKTSAPTYSQAFHFFREKYGLFVAPSTISYEDGPYLWFFEINSTTLPFGTDLGETDDFNTYEEAEVECLKKLIEIVKEKK